MATAFSKKIDSLAKEKSCEFVGEWKRSLVNHLYCSAISTPNGKGEVMSAKWMLMDNHTHSKHKGHKKSSPLVSTRHCGDEVGRRSGSNHISTTVAGFHLQGRAGRRLPPN